MNNQQVEYFLSAAERLNFTKAAEEHHTSQPTISRQIALLEEELGFPLFVRDKVRLSPGGAVMVQTFKDFETVLSEAKARAFRVGQGLEGKISIGYLSHLNTDMFVYPPAFEFSRRYPGIDMTLEAATFSELRRKLNSGEYDMIYTYSFELPELENVIYEKTYSVTPMIVMSVSHPLAVKSDIRASDFSGQIFLLPTPDESRGRRNELVSICKKVGIRDISIRNMDNLESMMFGIRSGWGVALLSSGTQYAYDSRCITSVLPDGYADEPLYIAAVRKKDNINPVLPMYMDICSGSTGIDVFIS